MPGAHANSGTGGDLPLLQCFSDEQDSDLLMWRGQIFRPNVEDLIDLCCSQPLRTNVAIILVTPGGDPDAAFRLARCLQVKYEGGRVTLWVIGPCKSAGTLVAIGAHEIAFGPHGELGPLDIQMPQKDELVMSSGLEVLEAFQTLEMISFQMFENVMLAIQERSGGAISFKAATHIAENLVKEMMGRVYQQIDPMHVGKVGRAMKIALEYGEILLQTGGNVTETGLTELVRGYPDHGFVIDRQRAGRHFEQVRRLTSLEAEIIAGLPPSICRIPDPPRSDLYLSDPPKSSPDDRGSGTCGAACAT